MQQITEHIFRLQVPYKDIFTTVCLVKTQKGVLLFDTASYDTDAAEYVLPFLAECGVLSEQVAYIFISHRHGDHIGGLSGLLPHCPKAKILSLSPEVAEQYGPRVVMPQDGEHLLDVLQVAHVPGHTLTCMSLLDTRTGTLISGDCLQLYGIFGSGAWGANIHYPADHFAALERLKALPITGILMAHNYEPLGHWCEGQDVQKAYACCKAPLQQMRNLLEQHPDWTDEKVCEAYLASGKMPRITPKIVTAVRNAPHNIW